MASGSPRTVAPGAVDAMDRAELDRRSGHVVKGQLPGAGKRNPNDTGVSHRNHRLGSRERDPIEPLLPAIGESLGILAAAWTIGPKVLSPAVQFLSGNLIPTSALPGSEVEFNELVGNDGGTRMRQQTRKMRASR